MGNSDLESQPWDDDEPRARMLGRYELLGTLGTGGMATVYLARMAGEAGFQRLFAIKILHPHLMKESGFRAMFLDEARLAARLHHPNIVPIIDLSAEHDSYYVALEYIEGCSLSALLKKHRDDRPPRLLVPIMLDALAGLDAAHDLTDDAGKPMNLVHRDVSPQNILVGTDGSARITDFGIARAESRISGTRPGQLKGKIAYMSPEQIRGQTLDRRSDIFSAGAMLWSMLTGRKLFEGDNDAATMSNILELEIPRPSTIGLRPPAAFDEVCLRALERDLSKRYATAQQMEDALRQAAMEAGLLGSRRDVATWVSESFSHQLTARRAAIRNAATRPAAATTTSLPGFHPTLEFPSITPTASAVGNDAEIEVSSVPLPASAAPSAGTASKKRRLGIVLGIPLACAAGIAIWLAVHGGHEAAASKTPPAATPMTAMAKTDDADGRATTYLDEAERLIADRRIEAAQELIAKARAAGSSNPGIDIRIANLTDAARMQPVTAPSAGAVPKPAAAATKVATTKSPTKPPVASKATKKIAAAPTPSPAATITPATPAATQIETTPAPPPAAPAPTAAVAATPPATKAAPVVVAPTPAVATKPASTEIAAPRLPATYSARSMKELQKVLDVIEGEAIAKGNAPDSIRGVTSGIAEEAFSAFAPGQLIEVHPRAIYYAIAKAARDGKAAASIRGSLKTAFQHGQL